MAIAIQGFSSLIALDLAKLQQTSNEIEGLGPIFSQRSVSLMHQLPLEVLIHLFGYLDVQALLRNLSVCTRWQCALAVDPKEIDPWHNKGREGWFSFISKKMCNQESIPILRLPCDSVWASLNPEKVFSKWTIIDQRAWETLFGKELLSKMELSFDGIPPLARPDILKEMLRLELKAPVKGDKGWALMAMPAYLTLKKIADLVQSVKNGDARIRLLNRYGLQQLRRSLYKASTTQSSWTAVSNEVLEGSEEVGCKKTLSPAQKELVRERFVQRTGCQLVDALSIMTFLMFKSWGLPKCTMHFCSPVTVIFLDEKKQPFYFYGGKTPSLTMILDGPGYTDDIGERKHLEVGDRVAAGDEEALRTGEDWVGMGAAAMKKFSSY